MHSPEAQGELGLQNAADAVQGMYDCLYVFMGSCLSVLYMSMFLSYVCA